MHAHDAMSLFKYAVASSAIGFSWHKCKYFEVREATKSKVTRHNRTEYAANQKAVVRQSEQPEKADVGFRSHSVCDMT